jgi:dTDP-4-amino-4,6-dideoxy-D-galactose acyltransferase
MLGTALDLCRLLEWDSSFFGFCIARVQVDRLTEETISQIDAWCSENHVRCLYFLARPDDPATTRLAEDNSFRLVDVRLTFARDLPSPIGGSEISHDGAALVRTARPEDLEVMRRIARESHRTTRFYYDPNFPPHLRESLYETWITQSCQGYADRVLVAELDSLPVGYLTCHLYSAQGMGSIGLVGVSSHVQGRQIGQQLVREALSWFAAQGAREVSVVTQGRNLGAQRLYQRCGFLTRSVQLWYHRWYEREGTRHG